jgi:outer membrane protein assembly factor BamB
MHAVLIRYPVGAAVTAYRRSRRASTPVVSRDGTAIYLTTTDGNLISVDSDGKLQWTFKANDTFRALPAIAPDGSIYLRLRPGGPPTISSTHVVTDSNGHP